MRLAFVSQLLSLLCVSFLFLPSCSKNPVTGKKQLNIMSEQQEIAMGRQSDPAVVATYGIYDDAKLQAFIDGKGQQMARISHRPNLKFEFKIMDSPVVNAFALPGGYVYFTRGIMAYFNNEAQFAGVLGHEIGHVTAKHSARQYTNQLFGQVALIGGMIALPEMAQYGQEAIQGMQMMFLKFGRDHETESDELGVAYSTRIGYDAHQMADFFKTLHRLTTVEGQAPLPTFLSTHPDPLDRFATVNELATKAQQSAQGPFDVNRASYLRMIDGMVFGEDPRQGFLEKNVFYHPELRFKFNAPSNWKYMNTPSQVQFGEPNGKAAIILEGSAAKTVEEAMLQNIEQNKLQVIEQEKESRNGMTILKAITQIDQQDQATGETSSMNVLHYFIQYNGKIYAMHGLAQSTDFRTYFPIFESCFNSFNKLTDPTKINVKPERIKIQTVATSKSLQQALFQFNMPADRMNDLAVLNGMELTTILQKGELIKTLERK